ncbi:hypothetical protein NB476_02010, partial [Vibrio sp. RM-44-3]|uniref:hypothetical protein n=1 Tax=Vibrio sp. RM-44-3 TaxID=2950156 RepID=UPI00215C4AB7
SIINIEKTNNKNLFFILITAQQTKHTDINEIASLPTPEDQKLIEGRNTTNDASCLTFVDESGTTFFIDASKNTSPIEPNILKTKQEAKKEKEK